MVHKYKQNGLNIVLDVESGAIHLVDDVSYSLLDYVGELTVGRDFNDLDLGNLFGVYDAALLKEAYSELVAVHQKGLLFSSKSCSIDEKFLDESLSSSPIKSICLNVAHDCNLRCKYCFASTGDFGADRKLMSLEIAKASIDFLLEKSGSRHNLEVDFFGGEPLLNFPVVKDTVLYARDLEKNFNKKFRFTITTNGILLNDEIINFINEQMDNVVLSLDGRQSVNDDMRITLTGNGSYATIVPKFQQLVSRRGEKDYYVRGTFTRKNLDFSKDVLHLHSLGFDQISVEPVVSKNENPFAITEKDVDSIEREYEKLVNSMIDLRRRGGYFDFFHFMIDFENGPCVVKKLKGCGCGNEYIAITPDGKIYPCHQFVGEPEWVMGGVTNKDFSADIRRKFINANIFKKDGCTDCWAKFFCSGGCNANNFKFTGDIKKPHSLACKLQKKRIECAIFLNLVNCNCD